MCIRLPRLPLEALRDALASACPLAVMEEQGGQPVVHLANRQAAAAGIRSGQTLSAALALAPALETLPRRPRRERTALESVADWATRFTPLVSLEPPDALLLEVKGSLRLFRGLERLCGLISDGLEERGHRARLCSAPTPLAALWLSRAGTARVETPGELPRYLNSLDLRVTGWSGEILRALDGVGVTTIGGCRRLPREGFARRFGMSRLQALDRAFGSLPDPRPRYNGSLSFCERLDLGEESLDAARLMEGCSRLLSALEDFLLRHQRAARRLRFRFFDLRGEATPLVLGFSEAGRDVDHWRDLLGIRLEQLRLRAPVITIELASGRLESWRGETPALPLTAGETGRQCGGPPRLVESLRARLGEDAVLGLRTLPEHRPRRAWDEVDPLGETGSTDLSPWGRLETVPEGFGPPTGSGLLLERPLWLLKEPQRLVVQDGCPCHDGFLDIVAGPERIESGWWDGADTAHDYYVAETGAGIRLWIYRDRRRPDAWYLQGIFG
ncbi:MAG: DNA polymerase Y family protein [Gammaproteobacteria bacterium]